MTVSRELVTGVPGSKYTQIHSVWPWITPWSFTKACGPMCTHAPSPALRMLTQGPETLVQWDKPSPIGRMGWVDEAAEKINYKKWGGEELQLSNNITFISFYVCSDYIPYFMIFKRNNTEWGKFDTQRGRPRWWHGWGGGFYIDGKFFPLVFYQFLTIAKVLVLVVNTISRVYLTIVTVAQRKSGSKDTYLMRLL